MRKRLFKAVLILLITTFLFEILLRIYAAYGPSTWLHVFVFSKFKSYATKNENFLEPHDRLGWQPKVGQFQAEFNVDGQITKAKFTFNQNRIRINPSLQRQNSKGEVALIGGSFLLGQGIDDDKVAAAHLAALQPNMQISNLAVPGYGAYLAYLRLKDFYTKRRAPSHVVYGYIRHHDLRNVHTYEYNLARHALGTCGYRIPYALLRGGQLWPQFSNPYECDQYDKVIKNPLKSLALIIFFYKYATDSRRRIASEVSRKSILAIKAWAEARGARFAVADVEIKGQSTQFIKADVEILQPRRPIQVLAYDATHPAQAFQKDLAKRISTWILDNKKLR